MKKEIIATPIYAAATKTSFMATEFSALLDAETGGEIEFRNIAYDADFYRAVRGAIDDGLKIKVTIEVFKDEK